MHRYNLMERINLVLFNLAKTKWAVPTGYLIRIKGYGNVALKVTAKL